MRKFFVYSIFAEDGSSLYVGCTQRLGNRINEHAGARPWWSEVARIESVAYPSEDEALIAERDRIAELRPRHNRMPGFTPRDPAPLPPLTHMRAGRPRLAAGTHGRIRVTKVTPEPQFRPDSRHKAAARYCGEDGIVRQIMRLGATDADAVAALNAALGERGIKTAS